MDLWVNGFCEIYLTQVKRKNHYYQNPQALILWYNMLKLWHSGRQNLMK